MYKYFISKIFSACVFTVATVSYISVFFFFCLHAQNFVITLLKNSILELNPDSDASGRNSVYKCAQCLVETPVYTLVNIYNMGF